MKVTLGRLINTLPTWWCVMVDPDRVSIGRYATVALAAGADECTSSTAADTVHRRICAAALA